MRTGERPSRRQAGGFTYLWLLFALVLGGVALAALGELEQTRQRREREAELRFRGEAIAAALGRYAEATPIGTLPLPQQLDDLLTDRRFPKPRHHLRQLYTDPFTGRADWEPVMGQAAVVTAAEAEDTGAASPAPTLSGSPKPPPPSPGASSAAPPVAPGIVAVRSRSTQRLFATAGGRRAARDWVFSPPQNTAETAAP